MAQLHAFARYDPLQTRPVVDLFSDEAVAATVYPCYTVRAAAAACREAVGEDCLVLLDGDAPDVRSSLPATPSPEDLAAARRAMRLPRRDAGSDDSVELLQLDARRAPSVLACPYMTAVHDVGASAPAVRPREVGSVWDSLVAEHLAGEGRVYVARASRLRELGLDDVVVPARPPRAPPAQAREVMERLRPAANTRDAGTGDFAFEFEPSAEGGRALRLRALFSTAETAGPTRGLIVTDARGMPSEVKFSGDVDPREAEAFIYRVARSPLNRKRGEAIYALVDVDEAKATATLDKEGRVFAVARSPSSALEPLARATMRAVSTIAPTVTYEWPPRLVYASYAFSLEGGGSVEPTLARFAAVGAVKESALTLALNGAAKAQRALHVRNYSLETGAEKATLALESRTWGVTGRIECYGRAAGECAVLLLSAAAAAVEGARESERSAASLGENDAAANELEAAMAALHAPDPADRERVEDGSASKKASQYAIRRLYDYDAKLFKTYRSGKGLVYSKTCPAVDGRQPVVLSLAEETALRERGYRLPALAAGEEGAKNMYVCPEVWCPSDGVPMTRAEYSAAGERCPGGGRGIDMMPAKYWRDAKGKRPKFLNETAPEAQRVPCCYKARGDDVGKAAASYTLSADAALEPGRQGLLAPDDSAPWTNMRRVGTKDRSFLAAMAHAASLTAEQLVERARAMYDRDPAGARDGSTLEALSWLMTAAPYDEAAATERFEAWAKTPAGSRFVKGAPRDRASKRCLAFLRAAGDAAVSALKAGPGKGHALLAVILDAVPETLKCYVLEAEEGALFCHLPPAAPAPDERVAIAMKIGDDYYPVVHGEITQFEPQHRAATFLRELDAAHRAAGSDAGVCGTIAAALASVGETVAERYARVPDLRTLALRTEPSGLTVWLPAPEFCVLPRTGLTFAPFSGDPPSSEIVSAARDAVAADLPQYRSALEGGTGESAVAPEGFDPGAQPPPATLLDVRRESKPPGFDILTEIQRRRKREWYVLAHPSTPYSSEQRVGYFLRLLREEGLGKDDDERAAAARAFVRTPV